MARSSSTLNNNSLLEAALEGLKAQRARIEDQIEQVQQMLGGRRPGRPAAVKTASAAPAPRAKRQLSAAARKRIAAAQKKRWAEYRKKTATKQASKAE